MLCVRSVSQPHKKTPLSEDQLKGVATLLKQPEEKIILSAYNIDLKQASLNRLWTRRWLDDESINFYMELLRERQLRNIADSTKPADQRYRCYFHNSFFYAKLYEAVRPPPPVPPESQWKKVYNYANVKRWTKRAKVKILEDVDLMFIPTHTLNKTHWYECLLIPYNAASDLCVWDGAVV